MSGILLLIVVTFVSFSYPSSALTRCHMCVGWSGPYPPGNSLAMKCNNLNEVCSTDQFCVKRIDPLKADVAYETYTSACFNHNQVTMTNGTNVRVVAGKCYDNIKEGNLKMFKMCFCNTDYCNGAITFHCTFVITLILIVMALFSY